MATNVLTFVIVGHEDRPVYEADLSSRAVDVSGRDDRAQYLHQFVLHAALDGVEELQWQTPNMYLSVVDKFNNLQVSAFITAAQMKFLMLHDGKNEDSIKAFFKEVYEVFLRVMLNPFFTTTTRITSPAFDRKVRTLARAYFRA